jgi:hypothetical protein
MYHQEQIPQESVDVTPPEFSPIDGMSMQFKELVSASNLGQENRRGIFGIETPQEYFAKLGAKAAFVAVSAGVILGGTAAWGQHIRTAGVHASADLDKAVTKSSAKMLAFNEHQDIRAVTAYFEETFTATQISYDISWQPIGVGPDVIPNPQVNKQLKGVGQESFLVPFTALSKPKFNKTTGDTVVEVDRSKVKVSSSWAKDSPSFRDFTISDGQKNFGHRDGFRSNLVHAISGVAKGISIDKFSNTLDDLDTLTEHAMSAKALETFSQECPSKLDNKLEMAITKALRANMATLAGQDPSKLEVTFTPGEFVWTEEKLPDVVLDATKKTYDYDADKINVDRNFTVDEMKCNVSGVKSTND